MMRILCILRMQRIQRFQRVLRAVCNYGKKTHALGILRMAQNCGKTRILRMPKNVEIDLTSICLL